LIKIDDPRLDPIWEECGRLGIPVAIHTSDPEAFFKPIDHSNERYFELGQYPEWSFDGPNYPSKKDLLSSRDRVFAKFPDTTFVALHMGGWPENLHYLTQMLRNNKNVMIEFGSRQAELGRQPRYARRFLIEFKDRVLFGSDAEPKYAMYQNYFRWLETDDEHFEPWGWPWQGFWRIYGLDLPKSVLKKVYYKNAQRIFRQYKGVPKGTAYLLEP